MKRKLYLIILLAAITLSGMAQTIGEAFYIYRNDGQFNAFFRDEVISIDYSYEDANGNTYDEIVTQIVNTADSVYVIPLAAIDSVGFVQPQAIINSNVYELTAKHSSYILQADTLSFVLKMNTPEELQPRVGSIVVSTYDCLSFPNGIMAKVISRSEQLDGIYYNCNRVSLDDVYDQIVYYGYGDVIETQNGSQSRTRAEARASGILWDTTIEGNVNYSGTSATLSNHIRGAFEIVLKKTLGSPMYARLTFGNELTSQFSFNGTSEVDFKPDPMKIGETVVAGRIVIPDFPLIWFEPQISLFGYFEEEGAVNIDFSAHYRRLDKFQLTCSNKMWSFNHTTPVNESGIDVASLSMKGYAEVGIQPEIMISLNGFPTGIGITTRMGLKESIDFKLDALKYFDEGIYESVKDSKTEESVTLSGGIFAQLGLFEDDCLRGEFTIAKAEFPISSHYILPTFSPIEKTKSENKANTYIVKTSINRDLLLPVNVGFGLFSEDGEIIQSKYSSQTYRLEKDWTLNGLTQTFEDIDLGEKYTCSPMVKFLGIEMQATPSTDIGDAISIETGDVKNISSTSANIYGKIIAEDLSSILGHEYGICFTEKGSTEGWDYIPANNLDSDGNFSVLLAILEAETEYIYCAYLEIEKNDYIYGDEVKFKTEKKNNNGFKVETETTEGKMTKVGPGHFYLYGKLIHDNFLESGIPCINVESSYFIDASSLDFGISYKEKDSSNDWTNVRCDGARARLGADGLFSVPLPLKKATEYMYRAYINIDGDYQYGNEHSYSTGDYHVPMAITGEVIDKSSSSLTVECTYKYIWDMVKYIYRDVPSGDPYNQWVYAGSCGVRFNFEVSGDFGRYWIIQGEKDPYLSTYLYTSDTSMINIEGKPQKITIDLVDKLKSWMTNGLMDEVVKGLTIKYRAFITVATCDNVDIDKPDLSGVGQACTWFGEEKVYKLK